MNRVLSMRDTAARARKCLSSEGRSAVAAFTVSRRCPDGGYRGRLGASDLYYTLFAAGTLDALGRRRSLFSLPGYLGLFGEGDGLDFVHLACLARLLGQYPWRGKRDACLSGLEKFRSRDGGYHHAVPCAPFSSAYALYLAVEAYSDAGLSPPKQDCISAALGALRVPGGGYANEPGSPHAQTNATAAGCLVRMHANLPPEPECADFLLARLDPEVGGFYAYPGARCPDLLSTAAALYALREMGVPLGGLAPRCRTFVELLWTGEGGFTGHVGDTVPDCEYTFYALLALGVLI